MRIKPYIILGIAAVCTVVAVVAVVTISDPYTAPLSMVWLFWAALFFLVWSIVATFFSFAGQRLALALSNGLFWAAGIISMALLSRRGVLGIRLSIGIIVAIIAISFFTIRRARRQANANAAPLEITTHHDSTE